VACNVSLSCARQKNRNVFRIDLAVCSELLSVTVLSSWLEQLLHLAKSVSINCLDIELLWSSIVM